MIFLTGCADPYRITDAGDDAWFRQAQSSAARDGRLSGQSAQYLRQHALQEAYQRGTRDALDALLIQFDRQPARPAVFVLAELCLLEGARHSAASDEALRCNLSAAIFAYAYLFDPELPGDSSPVDRRYRLACEIYNRALTRVLARRPLKGSDWNSVHTLASLVGPVRVADQTWTLPWPADEFDRFELAHRYRVSDIENPSHHDGLGVPLVAFRARRNAEAPAREDSFLPNLPSQVTPATICVRFHGSIVAAVRNRTSEITADLAVIDPIMVGSIQIEGRAVPIETDLTTPLAFGIQTAPHVSGFKGFIDTTSWEDRRGLYMVHPYQKGKIPVVFVNGLLGTPMTWVQMFNSLIANEVLRSRYQFWYFMYPTGNPVLYSAAVLRGELQKARQVFDPEGADPAFNQMVIVGHSMGGVVTRLQVTDSGSVFWNAVTSSSFDSIKSPEPVKDLVRSVFFFESLPFVKRVVFMATPHRGSAMADEWFARLFSADVKLSELLLVAIKQFGLMESTAEKFGMHHAPTAVEGLSDQNPVLLALDRLPIASGVKYDSIIANRSAAGRTGGTDSIVTYASAHLDGAETETIIHSTHGCTRNPTAIYEVERILLTHLAQVDAGGTSMSPPPLTRARINVTTRGGAGPGNPAE